MKVAFLLPGMDSAPPAVDYLMCLTRMNDKLPLGRMDAKRAEELLSSGQLTGAVAASTRTCLDALKAGVSEAAILDDSASHALLLYLLDQHTPGTMIIA